VRDDLPIGTGTLLFTDVEGSTKLLHELGDDGDRGRAFPLRRFRSGRHGGLLTAAKAIVIDGCPGAKPRHPSRF